MNRNFRIRRFNPKTKIFDVLFPQTLTENILRRNDGGVLENYLMKYDRHVSAFIPHLNRATSTGTYRHLEAHIHGAKLVDEFPLLLKLHTNLECDPTLNFNGTGAKNIITGNGKRIPGGQCAGTILFLVWSEELDAWTLLSSDSYDDITRVLLPVKSHYVYAAEYDNQNVIMIPDFNYNTDRLVINYGQTILRPGLDYDFQPRTTNVVLFKHFSYMAGDIVDFEITKYKTVSRRGSYKYDLVPVHYDIEITKDDTTVVTLPVTAAEAHSITFNYGQTILREGLDYTLNIDELEVTLKFPLQQGDILSVDIERFQEINGDVNPNNWGATGNYRYSLKVLHEEYTSTKQAVTVIPVPNYNRRKDEITVIRDNKMLVLDVDYTIDPLNQVVLLTSHLDIGDSIYFTILQGAMMDVPDFNVITATGDSGQHIHLDISYDLLCNHYVLLVKLAHRLETAPTAKCIDGPAEPIIDCFGSPVLGGYTKGAYMWLVYDEDDHCWYSLSHSQLDITSRYPVYLVDEGEANFTSGTPIDPDYDKNIIGETVIKHNLGVKPSRIEITPIEPPTITEDGERTTIGDYWASGDEEHLYVGNSGMSVSRFHWRVSTERNTTDLEAYINRLVADLKARPGNLYTKNVVYTATEPNESFIYVEGFRHDVDQIVVNYGQTILREGLDYVIVEGGIALREFALEVGDILQFIVIIQNDDIPRTRL